MQVVVTSGITLLMPLPVFFLRLYGSRKFGWKYVRGGGGGGGFCTCQLIRRHLLTYVYSFAFSQTDALVNEMVGASVACRDLSSTFFIWGSYTVYSVRRWITTDDFRTIHFHIVIV